MPCEHAEEDHAGGGDEREHDRDWAGPASSGAATPTSMSESAAAITTAASADCGRSASSELRNSSSTATRPAPTTPGRAGVLAPDCSATAVREPLVDTAKPWKKPAATFAAPDADHLLVRLDLVAPPGGEARRGGDRVGERHERDADGGDEQRPDVADVGPGQRRRRDALRQACRRWRRLVGAGSSTAETTVAPTTATRTAGHPLGDVGSTSRTTSTATPTASSVVASVWSRLVKNARTSSTKPSASVENPNSFGSWPTMIVIARPFM